LFAVLAAPAQQEFGAVAGGEVAVGAGHVERCRFEAVDANEHRE
jgi:hypothetical protein